MTDVQVAAASSPVAVNLLTENPVYKPFRYPWAYEAWLTQQRVHWLPEEVPLAEDVKDWHKDLTDGERNLLTQIFRFFTQADCFPGSSEILTPSGWRRFADLDDGERVAQVHEDGAVEFVAPLLRLEDRTKGT
jgi:Ribonucleotide reductase, small chain